ncbi:MAG: fimbria/pilus outer membrane usher protein [Rhizobiaceae bacterium]|nr:fimbria/pilus outer membrane usher protein [Rhizobiaceae bacterium]
MEPVKRPTKKQSKRAQKEDQMLGIERQTGLWKLRHFTSWLPAFFFLIAFLFPVQSNAQTIPDLPAETATELPPSNENLEPLFLEVMINEQPTNLIASFYRTPEGKIGASAAELNEIGVKTPANANPEDVIFLVDIPTVQYDYDETNQLLMINIFDEQRLAKEYNLRGTVDDRYLTQSGIGAVINYSLFATSGARQGGNFQVEDVSANLDGWLYGPLGKVYGSGIISTNDFNNYEFLRLDTTWTYSSVKTLNVYNVGDTISGGLAWTRPIRMGGIQVQKNFGLRPDLIATPLLEASGSAAVPSTVDIYIGNFKAYSQKVEAGPFNINQIPSVSGAGNARIVVTDATGREQETTKPFYISSNLLKKGLLDYSLEAGLARLNYGSISNNYSQDFVASGTFRYGLTDQFTVESHVEGSSNLINGGLGATFTLADRALISVAGSASRTDTGTGYQLYGSINTQILGLNIHASSRRSFGDYQDLASVTANDVVDTGNVATALTSTGVAKAFDQISIGIPLPKVKGGINLSFTHLENVINEASNVASISYSQRVFGNASLSVSAYSNVDGFTDSGVYVGLSFPLGEKIYASTSVENNDGELLYRVSASKSIDSKPGSWGWRLSDSEGSTSRRSAGVSYRGKNTFSQANVRQNSAGFQADAYVDGAVVVADSGIFLARRIDDAFAVVDTGEPDIPVYLSNQLIGNTNKAGKLLVPGLLSFEENRIKIDTQNLPVNASVESTNQKVIPTDGAGVNVRFGVQTQTRNAVVIFSDENGEFLKVGAEGLLAGSGSEFVVGYDGRTYLEGLSTNNTVTIQRDGKECVGNFDFSPIDDQQVEIGPVICQ